MKPDKKDIDAIIEKLEEAKQYMDEDNDSMVYHRLKEASVHAHIEADMSKGKRFSEIMRERFKEDQHAAVDGDDVIEMIEDRLSQLEEFDEHALETVYDEQAPLESASYELGRLKLYIEGKQSEEQ